MWEYRARILRCVDGDTVDVEIDLGFGVELKERLRLDGINTPERGRPNFHEATDRLRELCAEAVEVWGLGADRLKVRTRKNDATGKYGRPLVTILDPCGGMSINDQLIREGLAVPYMRAKDAPPVPEVED